MARHKLNGFERLITIVGAMKTPAQRLALSLGNFHGTNDFASRGT